MPGATLRTSPCAGGGSAIGSTARASESSISIWYRAVAHVLRAASRSRLVASHVVRHEPPCRAVDAARDLHDLGARARVRADDARDPLLRGLRPADAGAREARTRLRRARARAAQADPARQAPRPRAVRDRRIARPL